MTKYIHSSFDSIVVSLQKEYQFFNLQTYLLEHQTYLGHTLLPALFIKSPDHPSTKNTNHIDQQKYEQTCCNQTLILHYTHEKRLQTTKKLMHRLWQRIFNQTSIKNIKLIVGNRSKRNTKEEHVSQRITLQH